MKTVRLEMEKDLLKLVSVDGELVILNSLWYGSEPQVEYTEN